MHILNLSRLGEILIRRSLEDAFDHFGVEVKVARSDKEFEGSFISRCYYIANDVLSFLVSCRMSSKRF